MKTINKLINSGYDFTTNGDSIHYEYLFKHRQPTEDVIELLEEVKVNKQAAISYIKSIIKLQVNINEGYYSGVYVFMVTDHEGELLYTHQLETKKKDVHTTARYMYQKFYASSRFTTIAAFLSGSTGLFTYYGSDSKRRAAHQIELDEYAAACPW